MQRITRTFAFDAATLMRGKLRNFRRRGLWRLALAAVLVACALQQAMPAATPLGIGARALAAFAAMCALSLLVQWLAAHLQAGRLPPLTIAFSGDALCVHEGDRQTAADWRWLLAAEETAAEFVLWSRRGLGRLVLFLPKSALDAAQQRALRGWLAVHGKLPGFESCPRCRARGLRGVGFVRATIVDAEGRRSPASYRYAECIACGARLSRELRETDWSDATDREWAACVPREPGSR